jgi:glycosyltransferase involved in cell wall biosynthesis
MSVWRAADLIRTLARKLPSWIKRPVKGLIRVADESSKRLGLTVAASLEFPTAKLALERETIILIVHEATRTGAPILAWNLVINLQNKYNTVVVLRCGGAIRRAFENAAAAVICLPDQFPMRAVEIEDLASKIVDAYAPKYAIANSVESRFLIADFEALNIPVVALIHEFSSFYRPVGALYGLFSTASSIVFSAQLVADEAASDYKILDGREFKVLPQGPSRLPLLEGEGQLSVVDIGKACPCGSKESFCVVGIGTITMRKGVDVFIAVAAAVKQMISTRPINFIWVGTNYAFDQPYFDFLAQQVKKSDLAGAFRFVGELENLDPIYNKADILLLTSRFDPLPNVAIDCAVRGMPVVCFDRASGIAEIFAQNDDTCDLVVPYLNSGAAAQLICNLAEDPNRLAKFSLAVAEVARQRFNMENYVRKIDELGQRASHQLHQMKEDFKTIGQSESFNSDLNLGHEANSISCDEAIFRYLRGSKLAAPWNKPRANLFMRRPLAGFNPLVYAAENEQFDPHGLEDPLAHFLRAGRPTGPWTHRVIAPISKTANRNRLKKVALHGHFHYPDLLPDFITRLKQNSNSFDLFLTTTSQAKAREIADIISEFRLRNVEITAGSNRGRDLAPFLQQLNNRTFSGYEVVGHFHSKRSPHVDGAIGERWREFMWEHLIGGNYAIADDILEAFADDPKLGLVFAEDPHMNGWDENLKIAAVLATRMKIAKPLRMHFDFPIGTMFWARPDALEAFNQLDLCYDDFPAEPLPIDGTLLHALERLIPFAAVNAGFGYATTYIRESKR